MDNPERIAQQLKSDKFYEIYGALIIVRDHYVKHFDKMKELEKYLVIQIIVSYLEHPQLCSVSLTIINEVCHEEIWAFKVIKYNGIKMLTQVMENLPNDDIQNQVCKIVANIANYEVDFKVFQTIKLVTNIITFLLATKKIAFKQTAVQTLCILGKDAKCRDLIIHENGIVHIAEVLNTADKDFTMCCIQALAKLTENCNINCVQQIRKIKFLQILVNLYDKSENNIKAHIIKSLKNLTTLEMARSDVTKAGAIKIFAEVATDYKSFSNAKLALLGLCNCLDYIHMWGNYGLSRIDGLKVLVEALRYNDFKDIHYCIIDSLFPLTYEQGLATVLIELDLISILMQILKTFTEQHMFDHTDSIFHTEYIFYQNSSTSQEFQLNNNEDTKSNKSYILNCDDLLMKDQCKHNTSSVGNTKNIEACNSGNSFKGSNDTNTYYVKYFSSNHFLKNYNFTNYSFNTDSYRSPKDISSGTPLCNFNYQPSLYSYSQSEGKSSSCSSKISSADNIECDISSVSIARKNNVPNFSEHVFTSVETPKTTISAETNKTTFVNLFPSCNNNELNKYSVKHTNFTSDKSLNEYNVYSNEKFVVKEQEKCITKHCMSSDACSDKDTKKRYKLSEFSHQNLERKKNFPSPIIKNTKQQTLDSYVLALLAQLSFHLKKKCNSHFASSACFSILLQYIICIKNASPKAENILLLLVKNRFCFEKLIMSGFVSEMDDILKIIHDPKICLHCSRICSLYKKLKAAIHEEVGSEYGIGTLGHILCTAGKIYRFHAIYTIGKLINSKSALYKTLIQAKGLAILFDFLSDFSDCIIWKKAVLCLCGIYQSLKSTSYKKSKNICCTSQTCGLKLSTKCVYKGDIFDIIFVIENGIKIGASREKISRNSDYFQALLNGNFQESNKDVIKLCGLSAEALTSIFHFLHGCYTTEYCPYINRIPFETLLELLQECDRILLFDAKSFIEDRLCHSLYPTTVLKICKIAKMYNSTSLYNKAIEYALSLDITEKEILLQCFQGLRKLDNSLEVFNDIKKIIENMLIDFR